MKANPFHIRMMEQSGEHTYTFKYEFPFSVRKRILTAWKSRCSFSDYIRKGKSNDNIEIPYVEDIYKEWCILFGWDICAYSDYAQFEQIRYRMTTKNVISGLDDDKALSAVEVICQNFPEIIDEVNTIFAQEHLGYKFNKDTQSLLRLEDETFFEECTCRSLSILSKYPEIIKQYRDSYKKLSEGKYSDSILDAAKTLESVLKTRFEEAGITYDKKNNLRQLLEILEKNIIKNNHYSFQNFKNLIQDVGTYRNENSAHGQAEGKSPVLEDVYVRFIINQVAANVLFISEVELKQNNM